MTAATERLPDIFFITRFMKLLLKRQYLKSIPAVQTEEMTSVKKSYLSAGLLFFFTFRRYKRCQEGGGEEKPSMVLSNTTGRGGRWVGRGASCFFPPKWNGGETRTRSWASTSPSCPVWLWASLSKQNNLFSSWVSKRHPVATRTPPPPIHTYLSVLFHCV